LVLLWLIWYLGNKGQIFGLSQYKKGASNGVPLFLCQQF